MLRERIVRRTSDTYEINRPDNPFDSRGGANPIARVAIVHIRHIEKKTRIFFYLLRHTGWSSNGLVSKIQSVKVEGNVVF